VCIGRLGNAECLGEGEEMTGHDPSDKNYYEPALDTALSEMTLTTKWL
jgi:hypothetical protein